MTQITDTKLFTLFTGQQDLDKITRNGEHLVSCVRRLNFETEEMEDFHCSVYQDDLEDIKDIINSGVLRSLPSSEHLLLILWIREILFGMGSLPDSDRLGFVQNVFAISGIDIGEATMEAEFRVLWNDKDYIHIETAGDKIKNYLLTPEGACAAEEIYFRMTTVASYFIESAPLASEEATAACICMTETSTETLTQPKLPPKHERDRRIYELACVNTHWTWGLIADAIIKEFPDECFLTDDSVSEAARRYRRKHKLPPIPERDPGRKPKIPTE